MPWTASTASCRYSSVGLHNITLPKCVDSSVVCDLSGQIAPACSLSNHFSPDLPLLFKLHQIWSVDSQENS